MTPDTHTAHIARLRALREQATPENWSVGPCSHGGLVLLRGPQSGRKRAEQSHLQVVPAEDAAFIVAAANEALPLLSDLEKRIEELERELVFVKSHHTARYVVNMTQENETLKARLEAAEAENRKLREAALALADAMETCHKCHGSVIVQESPTHCEDCSPDCDDHDEPDCEPIDVLHRRLKVALADKGGSDGA